MPQIGYGIPDIYEAITRPTHVNIIRSVMEATGISPDTVIEYSGEQPGIPAYRSFMDGKSLNMDNPEAPAWFSFFGKVQVSVNEEIDDGTLLSTAYHYNDNKTIFADYARGIYIRPYFEKVECTLNFKYRTVDKNEATRWRNDMRRRIKLKYSDESFVSEYIYAFPLVYIEFLKQFHRMKEAVEGDGDTLQEWIESNLLQDYTILANQKGENTVLAIRETQLDILGNFDFTTPPKDEKLEGGATYEIEFSYKFKYDRPFGMTLTYPLVIHNQLVPKKYRPDHVVYDPASFNEGKGSLSTSRYYQLLKNACGQYIRNSRGGTIVPYFDDWWPERTVGSVSPLAQFLTRVDPADPTLVLDLKELGSHRFDPLLLEYMQLTHRDVTKRGMSGVHISLYENNDLCDPSMLYVTDDLLVRTYEPMRLKNTYHLWVGLFNDLFVLHPDAQKLLRFNVKYLNLLLDGLEPDIGKYGRYPEIIGNKYVPDAEWMRVVKLITTTNERYRTDIAIMRPTALSTLLKPKE